MELQHVNCIVVFDQGLEAALFCKRKKEPYQGRLNFVGGKVEPGESSEHAAYRELKEETGIGCEDIQLFHLMDLTYYHLHFVLEIYVGTLKRDLLLKEEVNPLLWLSLSEDFTDRERFAGEQNIAHILNIAQQYSLSDQSSGERK